MREIRFLAGKDLPDERLVLERHQGQLRIVEHKQYAPELERRPPQHRHDYGQNQMPVLGFDLHRTLTPDIGFPLPQQPFPMVKAVLDQFAARGCCIHVISASLTHPDLDFRKARTRQVKAWARLNALPVKFVGPNTDASARLDDRAVNVPLNNPDWAVIGGKIEDKLAKTYTLGKDGLYVRRDDLQPVGTLIDDDAWPDDDDVPQDAPRGFSTPLIDIDFHRTLMPAWGTRRDAPPDPDAIRIVNQLFTDGYSMQMSCGGWNPATVNDPQFAIDRSAWQRRYLRQWGIYYDRLVAKDDVDVWTDDKVIEFTTWPAADKALRAFVGPSMPWPTSRTQPSAPIK